MKKFLFNFYQKYFSRKLFNKIFLLHAAITILSLLGLCIFISDSLIQTSKQKELGFNKQVLDSISTYLSQKDILAKNILLQLYGNNDLSADLASFLNNDFDKYSLQRLDKYMKNSSNTMIDFNKTINSFYLLDSDICNIALYSKEKNFFYITSNGDSSKNIQRHSLFDSAASEMAAKLFENNSLTSPFVFTDNTIFEKGRNVYGVVNGIKDPDTQKYIGAIVIVYDTKGIYKLYHKYAKDLKGYIVALTDNGTVLYDSSERYYGGEYPYFKLLSNTLDTMSTQKFEEKSLVNLTTTPFYDITTAGIIPESNFYESTKLVRRTLLIVTLILIAVSIMLTYFGILIFSRRTRTITAAMQQVQNGDLSIRIPIDKKEDELAQIGLSFNTMCSNLDEYIKKVYLLEIRQKKAELTALQSQVNPHFLYNTLEVIRIMAVKRGAADVGNAIYIMATLFRNTVKKKTIISITDEIEQCELYLKLFSLRYEGTFTFSVDLEDAILNFGIPKFSLQPIIENYIVHGIKHESTGNSISIKGFRQEEDIIFIVRDNGKGIEKENLNALERALQNSEVSPSTSIGLTNVNDRLKIIYGDQYGIHIESEIDVGTAVFIKIPAMKKGELINYA